MTIDVRKTVPWHCDVRARGEKLMQVEACLSTTALRGLLLDVGMNDV